MILSRFKLDNISNAIFNLPLYECILRATVIGLLKNWPVKFRPVIFGLLPYADEI